MNTSRPQLTECRSHLITLITTQDQICQSWIQHLIAVQGGLVIGLGFLLRNGDGGATAATVLLWFAVIMIPLLGMVTAWLLTLIILRERKWQAWYTHRFTKLSGRPLIFPSDEQPPTQFYELKDGYISQKLALFKWILILIWFCSLCFFAYQLGTSKTLMAHPHASVPQSIP